MRFLYAVIVLNTFFFIFLHILLPHMSLPASIIYTYMLIFIFVYFRMTEERSKRPLLLPLFFYHELLKKKPLLITDPIHLFMYFFQILWIICTVSTAKLWETIFNLARPIAEWDSYTFCRNIAVYRNRR